MMIEYFLAAIAGILIPVVPLFLWLRYTEKGRFFGILYALYYVFGCTRPPKRKRVKDMVD